MQSVVNIEPGTYYTWLFNNQLYKVTDSFANQCISYNAAAFRILYMHCRGLFPISISICMLRGL